MVFPRVVSSDLFYSCFILHPWVILWDTSQVAFHLYADDTPLTSESSSAELAKLGVKDCVRDIDAWMTVNKLKMNRDKTELVVLNASHRQPSSLTSIISVCDEVISKSSVATILVTNLETLVCVSPSPMSRWRRSEFGNYSRLSAPKYTWLNIREGDGHFWVRTNVWRVNVRNLRENSRETVSVSTICDEYCSNIGVLCDTFMSMKYLVTVSRMQGRPLSHLLPPSKH